MKFEVFQTPTADRAPQPRPIPAVGQFLFGGGGCLSRLEQSKAGRSATGELAVLGVGGEDFQDRFDRGT